MAGRNWVGLGVTSALCTALAWPVAAMMTAEPRPPPAATIEGVAPPMRRYALLMTAYGFFVTGYIGYMTFVIALLRSAGMSNSVVTAFCLVLGLATIMSSKLWAGNLQRARGGGALTPFCCLLSVATVIPAISSTPIAAFASGIVFGGTFLSVVAPTTAFVRHNLPIARWSVGISAFTADQDATAQAMTPGSGLAVRQTRRRVRPPRRERHRGRGGRRDRRAVPLGGARRRRRRRNRSAAPTWSHRTGKAALSSSRRPAIRRWWTPCRRPATHSCACCRHLQRGPRLRHRPEHENAGI